MSLADGTLAFESAPKRQRVPADAMVVSSGALSATTAAKWPPAGDWFPSAVARVRELALLADGWDGSVAPPPPAAALTWTVEFLDSVRQAVPSLIEPLLVPTINGGVAVEWHSDAGHVDFVHEGEAAEVYARSAEGYEWEGGLDEDTPEAVFEVLLRFRANV